MAGRIRDEDVALVREKARIDEIVRDYVALKLPSTEVRLVRRECYATLGESASTKCIELFDNCWVHCGFFVAIKISLSKLASLLVGGWLASLFPRLVVAPVGKNWLVKRIAETILRVLHAKVVTARANLSDCFVGECCFVDNDRVEVRSNHCQQICIEHKLLERGVKATFHPASTVH